MTIEHMDFFGINSIKSCDAHLTPTVTKWWHVVLGVLMAWYLITRGLCAAEPVLNWY